MELVVQLGVLTFECKFEILPKKKLNFRKYQPPTPPKKKEKQKRRKPCRRNVTFSFTERAAWTNSLPYEDAFTASLIFFDSSSDLQNEVMKSTEPSDACNSLTPPVPDYNKRKFNVMSLTKTRLNEGGWNNIDACILSSPYQMHVQ